MPLGSQALPPATWPMVDGDGRPTEPWFQAIQNLFYRTGGAVGNGVTQGKASPDLSALQSAISALPSAASVNALQASLTTTQATVATVQATIPPISASVAALEMREVFAGDNIDGARSDDPVLVALLYGDA